MCLLTCKIGHLLLHVSRLPTCICEVTNYGCGQMFSPTYIPVQLHAVLKVLHLLQVRLWLRRVMKQSDVSLCELALNSNMDELLKVSDVGLSQRTCGVYGQMSLNDRQETP
jgi:hypothetical protein